MTESPKVSDQIRWQCRRGMLELDLLLAEFLRNGYDVMTPAESGDFDTLLTYPDAVLLEWLMGREKPTDGALAHVIERIRDATTD